MLVGVRAEHFQSQGCMTNINIILSEQYHLHPVNHQEKRVMRSLMK